MLRVSLCVSPPKLTPNVREFLLSARKMGIACIPFTGNARAPALEKLRASGLIDMFDVDEGGYGDETMTKLEVLGRLKDRCRDAIVMGDSVEDVFAAKECGTPVVILATGWTSKSVLLQAEPDLTIENIPKDVKLLLRFLQLLIHDNVSRLPKTIMDSEAPEPMRMYFDSRADSYDQIHMREDICWGIGIRNKVAAMLPVSTKDILDMGAGTGIELEGILKRFPSARILCVDLSPKMLALLKRKFIGENVVAQEGDFRWLNSPDNSFDAVVSVMALHHLTLEEKSRLYRSVWRALRTTGVFISSDYILGDEVEQQVAEGIAELQRSLACDSSFRHIDRPLCETFERKLLMMAGFCCVEKTFENKKAKILVARK